MATSDGECSDMQSMCSTPESQRSFRPHHERETMAANNEERANEERANEERANEERATKRRMLDYTGPVVVILAGGQVFNVQQSIICAKSKAFAAACSPGGTVAEGRTIQLPDVHANVFTAFVHWLYTGTIDIELTDDQLREDNVFYGSEKEDRTIRQFHSLLHLYILAVKIDARELRNDIIDATLKHTDDTDKLPSVNVMSYAFQKLSGTCKLLVVYTRLVVDHQVKDDLDHPDYPRQLLIALARKWLRENDRFETSTRDISWKHRAKYHEADDEE